MSSGLSSGPGRTNCPTRARVLIGRSADNNRAFHADRGEEAGIVPRHPRATVLTIRHVAWPRYLHQRQSHPPIRSARAVIPNIA